MPEDVIQNCAYLGGGLLGGDVRWRWNRRPPLEGGGRSSWNGELAAVLWTRFLMRWRAVRAFSIVVAWVLQK